MSTDQQYRSINTELDPGLANGRTTTKPNGQAPAHEGATQSSLPIEPVPKAEEAERDKLIQARESFSGRLLTDAQFDEAIAITHIMEREIYKRGSFKDKLQDYAYAMARSENMDTRKLEGQIRGLFRERTGRTMNQMREELKSREDNATQDTQNMRDNILTAAHEIEHQMMNGDKITFNRASAEKSQTLADEFGVTDFHARKMMINAFETEQGEGGMSWKDWGEKMDAAYYRPQIEAEKEARAQAKQDGAEAGGFVRTSRRR